MTYYYDAHRDSLLHLSLNDGVDRLAMTSHVDDLARYHLCSSIMYLSKSKDGKTVYCRQKIFAGPLTIQLEIDKSQSGVIPDFDIIPIQAELPRNSIRRIKPNQYVFHDRLGMSTAARGFSVALLTVEEWIRGAMNSSMFEYPPLPAAPTNTSGRPSIYDPI